MKTGSRSFGRSLLFSLSICFLFTLTASIYWVDHHHLIRRVEHCNQRVLLREPQLSLLRFSAPLLHRICPRERCGLLSVALYAGFDDLHRVLLSLLRLAVGRLPRLGRQSESRGHGDAAQTYCQPPALHRSHSAQHTFTPTSLSECSHLRHTHLDRSYNTDEQDGA